jgi:hypothetical protein
VEIDGRWPWQRAPETASPFGAVTDVMCLNLGGSKSATRDLAIGGAQLPAGITANASLDIEGWVWTLAGTYRALSTPQASFDTFAGARLLSLKEKLNWAFSGNVGPFVGPGRQGSSQESLDNWDGIVGIKGRLNLSAGQGWFVPYYVDVGTGASHFTWQAIAGIGYEHASQCSGILELNFPMLRPAYGCPTVCKGLAFPMQNSRTAAHAHNRVVPFACLRALMVAMV